MQQPSADIRIAGVLFITFWIIAVVAIFIVARWSPRTRQFRDSLRRQWQPALAIALLFLLSFVLGGFGLNVPTAIAVFCQSLIGLALARGVNGFEPLLATQVIARRQQRGRNILLILGLALLTALLALTAGNIGMAIGHAFGETNRTSEAAGTLPSDAWPTFFLLLGGAGIAEETLFRLVCLSFFWRWLHRAGPAIFLSAVVFGAYHLTPLSGMYRIFWQFPVSQLMASVLIGIVWGYVYTKRGYETVVLGHTFGDWIPFMLFRAA